MSRDLQPHTSLRDGRRPPPRFRELEHVALLCDIPDKSLKRGEDGTIVHAFDDAEAYVIEFVNEDGSTRALAEVTTDQICLIP
jgi:hypothetical protein